METQNKAQIEDNVKALSEGLSPVFQEVELLTKALNDVKNNTKRQNTLMEIVSRITKTARRHDLDKKIKCDENEYTIGTNHNGLGYQEAYSSQLSDLSNTYYGTSTYKEKILRSILFDSDAIIDVISVIKKTNQKTFMKVVAILKKHNLKKSFNDFQSENIDIIEVDFGNPDYKIKVDLGRRGLNLILEKDTEEIGGISIDEINNKIAFEIEEETDELLKEISKKKITGLHFREYKIGLFMLQHKESIIKTIKAKRTLLNGVIEGYKKEDEELNNLLQPFLTLEKL